MIRLTAPQTYRVVYYALRHDLFTQTEINKKTGVSIGRVNQVTQWLIKRGYAKDEKRGYRLTAPASLVNLMSSFRSMDEAALLKRDIDAPREKLVRHLMTHGAVLCLTSALRHHDSYFRDPSLCAYTTNNLHEEIRDLPRGTTRIELYRPDLPLEDNTETTDSLRLTTAVRTIIDLFCADKAYAAERLIRKRW